jgi:hypothetical protein
MKREKNKISFIVVALILISSNAFSQQYNKLLGTTNQWNISTNFEGCGTRTFFTMGDTSILGVDYFKLFCPTCGIHGDTELVSLIREDTLQRKVFLRRFEYPNILDSAEFLYYDFGLAAGDSVFLYESNIFNQGWTQFGAVPLDWYFVDSITVLNTTVGNRNATFLSKRNLLFNQYDYVVWVEGIGAVDGYYIFFCISCWSWLDCEYKDGIQQFDGSELYPLLPDNECICTNIGVNEVDQKDLVSIYPNPVTSTLSIESTNGIKENFYLKIYSACGDFKEGNFLINRNSIDVSNLSNGIYFLELDLGGDFIRKPFIKM